MSRDKNYQRLLNDKRWKRLRAWKLMENPLCELCEQEGKVTAAVDIHHRVPVESASTVYDMERLCYNPLNLMSLCIPHHIALHTAMRSHTKEAVQANKDKALERWKERHPPRG